MALCSFKIRRSFECRLLLCPGLQNTPVVNTVSDARKAHIFCQGCSLPTFTGVILFVLKDNLLHVICAICQQLCRKGYDGGSRCKACLWFGFPTFVNPQNHIPAQWSVHYCMVLPSVFVPRLLSVQVYCYNALVFAYRYFSPKCDHFAKFEISHL